MTQYVLQIIHRPVDGGEGLIEQVFSSLHAAEAAGRRHKGHSMRPGSTCDTFIFQGNWTIDDDAVGHATHSLDVPGCKDCEAIDDTD